MKCLRYNIQRCNIWRCNVHEPDFHTILESTKYPKSVWKWILASSSSSKGIFWPSYNSSTTDEEKKRCEKGSLIVTSVKAAKDLFCLALWLWALLVAADALCMKTNASSVASKVAALIHLGPAHLTDKLNLSFHHSFAGRSITKEHCKNSRRPMMNILDVV